MYKSYVCLRYVRTPKAINLSITIFWKVDHTRYGYRQGIEAKTKLKVEAKIQNAASPVEEGDSRGILFTYNNIFVN